MTSIRAAQADDAAALAALLAQLGYPSESTSIPRRLAAIEAEGGVAFVAVDDEERVVGLTSGTRFSTIHADGQVAYITALVIDAEARGHGVGRALVSALEEWARGQGCARLAVTSAEHRADAHAFYPRCGFPYTGRRFTKVLTP